MTYFFEKKKREKNTKKAKKTEHTNCGIYLILAFNSK